MVDKKQFISGVCDLYDHRLLENSLTTEGNVCGILLSDLTYFDDCGLESKDFVTKHGRMLFNLGQQLREKGISNFGKKIKGFDAPDAVLTGVETRTSAPVRIIRGEDFTAPAHSFVYPCGEGAGYAGGIMSAAIDGLRVARAIMEAYAPIN